MPSSVPPPSSLTIEPGITFTPRLASWVKGWSLTADVNIEEGQSMQLTEELL